MASFEGKSVIVTGGASGIGKATALLLAQRGCKVMVADLNEEGCQQTVKEIESVGGQAKWFRTDVSSEKNVRDLVNETVSQFGRLDGAANVAGVGTLYKPLDQFTLEEWEHVIRINLTGSFLFLKYTVPAILKSGGGSVVLVASHAASIGFAYAGEYSASKAGVLGLVRSASAEYAKRGVRINGVLPGTTDTPLAKSVTDENTRNALIAAQPNGRIAEPDEIGNAIRWLLSDEASFITGVSMNVDGGLLSGVPIPDAS